MSRSCYSDDFGGDFPGQMDLFRANVDRSLNGKLGQQRLRELRDALFALPVKELYDGVFVEPHDDGAHVCALGAWALAKCGGDIERASKVVPDRLDLDDRLIYRGIQSLAQWPKLVVYETVFMNDDNLFGRHEETPAERYQRVLKWVRESIRE